MKNFMLDLFEYNNLFNNKIIAVMNEHPQEISEKCLKLFCHVLNVHRMWNYKIRKGEKSFERFQIHQLSNLQNINQENCDDSIEILNNSNLSQMINYSLSSRKAFTHSVQDILFHVINHSTYHRGQVASEFRQSGLEPIITDYIYYKML